VVAIGTVTVVVTKRLTVLVQTSEKLDVDLPCRVHSHGERKRLAGLQLGSGKIIRTDGPAWGA